MISIEIHKKREVGHPRTSISIVPFIVADGAGFSLQVGVDQLFPLRDSHEL
jgi:hypothetical protein